MKAVVFTRYGSPEVLELREVEKPVPTDDEILIRVHAASLNDWDHGALLGDSLVNRLIFGLFRPKKRILGSDIAGLVEAVGWKVTELRCGDAVFGDLSGRWGGFAEYVCARPSAVARMAPGMPFEVATALPQAGLLALQGLRAMGEFRPGQTLLINGAGGGVGTFAIQLAKRHGLEITAVDAPGKLERLRALGAAHVVDYTQVDFTRTGQCYDFILDVKTTRSAFHCARALNPRGTYVTVGGAMTRLLQALVVGPWIRSVQNKHIRILALKPNAGLAELTELVEAGHLIPVIEGSYALQEVPDALRYFVKGRHFGKVVVNVEHA